MPPHDAPGGDQVSTVVAGDVHGRPHDIFKTGTRGLKCHAQVGHHLLSLALDVPDGDNWAGLVDGADTSGENEKRDAHTLPTECATLSQPAQTMQAPVGGARTPSHLTVYGNGHGGPEKCLGDLAAWRQDGRGPATPVEDLRRRIPPTG